MKQSTVAKKIVQGVVQKIYTCDLCGKTPKDGELLWEMDGEIHCEECCKEARDTREDTNSLYW